VDIHRDELLRFLRSDRCDRVEEIDEFLRLIPRGIVKVQPILNLLDIDCVLVCPMFEDELFEVKESPLVGNLLSNLYASPPCIRSIRLRAVGTLLVRHHVFDFKCLLQYNAFRDGVLNGELDLYSSRMRLRPNETCVDNPNFVQTS
jgi:hypothetical protein